MNKFIIKTVGFSFIIIMIFIWVCSKANGYTDPFYIRFTTPKQSSLILGTSRAAQGLQPDVFDSILKKEFFNYAFTVGHSPFGETYLNSIKKKLKVNSTEGIFIITVDPWSISSFSGTPEDPSSFRERKLALAKTSLVNIKPNILYFLNSYNEKYYKVIRNSKSKLFLHNNGWLEVDVNLDSIDIPKNIEKKVITYREKHLPRTQFSANRYKYLKNTINFLKKHGKVYLVRLPIHTKMMQIEKELMPNFDNDINEAIILSHGYLDLTKKNSEFIYTDGNHLHKSSGKIVSEIVANWIFEIQNNYSQSN